MDMTIQTAVRELIRACGVDWADVGQIIIDPKNVAVVHVARDDMGKHIKFIDQDGRERNALQMTHIAWNNRG